MDPARKRKIRLVLALSTAVLLAVALIYTSFGAANSAVQPSELLAGSGDGNYQLNGIVVGGSVKEGDAAALRARRSQPDRADGARHLHRRGPRSVPLRP